MVLPAVVLGMIIGLILGAILGYKSALTNLALAGYRLRRLELDDGTHAYKLDRISFEEV